MFKADDRVRETSVTSGAVTYVLAGAVFGFQGFASLLNNTYVPYFATDDTDWETGIGRVLTGPDRLERTHIYASSNADAAVNWGATTKKIRCGMPAALAFTRKSSVAVGGAGGTTVLTQLEQRCSILEFTGALTGNRIIEVDDTPWGWTIINNTTGLFTLTVRAAGGTGVEFFQGRATAAVHDGADVRKAVDDPAPGTSEEFNGTTVQPGRLAEDGSNVARATYPALAQKLVKSSVVTFTNGTDRVNWAAHGLSAGDVFKFYTTGAAPTGLTASVAGGATTTYFVVSPTANDFQIAATEGGAAINFTTDGTGVATGIHAPHGDGDGATTVTLPDSRRKAHVGRGGSATAQLGARVGAIGGAESRTITTSFLPASGLSVSASGSMSGSASVSVPSRYDSAGAASSANSGRALEAGNSGYPNDTAFGAGGSASVSGSVSGSTSAMGSGNAFDEMQPSLVVTRTIRI